MNYEYWCFYDNERLVGMSPYKEPIEETLQKSDQLHAYFLYGISENPCYEFEGELVFGSQRF